MVRPHQRAAAGVAEQHDPLDALLAQEPDADADVGEGVVEHEVGLGAAEAGVPPEEPVAPAGHEVGQVVLGEVDVVVGGDERGRRVRVGGRRVPEALARVPAGAGAADDGRGQADERALDAASGGGGHRQVVIFFSAA